MSTAATLSVISSDLGQIPEDWAIDTLASLGGQVTSGSRGWAAFYADYGDLFVRITNLRRDNIHLDLAAARFVLLPAPNVEADRTRIKKGDLLISITADIGIVGYIDDRVPSPAYINQHIARVRLPSERVSSKFVAYYLSSWAPQRTFVGATDTGAKAGMNLATVGALKTVVPPLAEQVQIAATLTDVDDKIGALQRAIAKKEAIKQGVMQALLTGKTRLPGHVDPWQQVVLGDVVSFVRTVALSRAQLDGTSPLRYLHYGDIHTSVSVKLDAAHALIPRASASLAGTADRLRVGDLVFVDASEDPAGVGKAVEVISVPDEGIVPGLHTIAARFDKSVLADGFKAYLPFVPAFRTALLRLAAGTKVLATTRSHVSSVTLHLPKTDEQRAIATVLADADHEIDALRGRLVKAKNIKQGMMQQLLTGRTRLPIAEPAA